MKQDVREQGIEKNKKSYNRRKTVCKPFSLSSETIEQGIQRIQTQPEKEDAVVVEIAESNETGETKEET